MQAYTAHVGENGRIITDEKTDLPPGLHVKIAIVDDFTPEEEAALAKARSEGPPHDKGGPISG